MQTALRFAPLPCLPATARNFSKPVSSSEKLTALPSSRSISTKATVTAYETSVVDYSSTLSVFPAEACETIGGDACLADIYPEVKLKPEGRSNMKKIASEMIERDYLEYSDPRTVLLGDACDVLGGEFCERPYQTGIY